MPVLKRVQARASIRAATTARRLLGLRGIVVKSHGSADAFAFGHALERAVEEVRNGVPQRIAAAHGADASVRKPRMTPCNDLLAHRRHRQLPAARRS